MKYKNYFVAVGIIIYIVLSIIDKLIYKLNNYVYLSIALLALITLIIGIVLNKKKK